MNKKFLSLMLIGFLLNLFFYTSTPANSLEKEARNTRKVKSEIMKLGSGTQSKVKLKLRDNSQLSGYINEIGENSFTVIESQTGKATEISYSKVKKAWGKNFSTGQKILIGIAIAYVILMFIAFASTDDY